MGVFFSDPLCFAQLAVTLDDLHAHAAVVVRAGVVVDLIGRKHRLAIQRQTCEPSAVFMIDKVLAGKLKALERRVEILLLAGDFPCIEEADDRFVLLPPGKEGGRMTGNRIVLREHRAILLAESLLITERAARLINASVDRAPQVFYKGAVDALIHLSHCKMSVDKYFRFFHRRFLHRLLLSTIITVPDKE